MLKQQIHHNVGAMFDDNLTTHFKNLIAIKILYITVLEYNKLIWAIWLILAKPSKKSSH